MLILLSLFGATVSVLDENDLYIGRIISASFIAFPFLYGVVFMVFRISRKITSMCWSVLLFYVSTISIPVEVLLFYVRSFALKRWTLTEAEAALSSLNEKVLYFKKLTTQLLEEQPEEPNIQGSGSRDKYLISLHDSYIIGKLDRNEREGTEEGGDRSEEQENVLREPLLEL